MILPSAGQEIIRGPAGAPAVLFLHGFMGEGADWMEVVDELCEGFRCICPDLPGHGRNCSHSGTPFTIEHAAVGLLRRLDALGVDTCGIAGYSMGGRLALYLALQHPARFTRVVLESASPGIRNEEERRQREQHDRDLANRLESLSPEAFSEFVKEWYDQPMFASLARDPGRREQLVTRRLHNDPAGLAASLRGMGVGSQISLWEKLGGYSTPTVLLVGELDHKFRQIAEDMSESLPCIAPQCMGGCGHNVHFENPSGYTMALKRFFGVTA